MLRVAIVGAGTMGRVHGSSYLNVEGAKVAAVCDKDGEKAGTLARLHGASSYTDYSEMLENEEVDIIDICLPTYMHKDYALKAFSRGRHVFCEKPIAHCIRDAEEMVSAAEKSKVKFSVGHVVRYFPAYCRAVEVVMSGKIGTPKLIRTTRTGSYPAWSWENWYGDVESSGGTLLDLVIHDFDWIRHNFSEVERVYAKSLMHKGIKNCDHCLVILRLKSGAIAHVEGSWAYPAGSVFGTTFEIVGTKGQVEFDSRTSTPVKKHICNGDSVKIVSESPLFSGEEPYTAELQAFVNCVLKNAEPEVPGEDAIKALEISLAAIESSKTGRVVTLGGARG